MNTDGSDGKTIVTDCHMPDDVVVDVDAGHIYWTDMGIPDNAGLASSVPMASAPNLGLSRGLITAPTGPRSEGR
jgi:hypothetical protein